MSGTGLQDTEKPVPNKLKMVGDLGLSALKELNGLAMTDRSIARDFSAFIAAGGLICYAEIDSDVPCADDEYVVRYRVSDAFLDFLARARKKVKA